MVRAVSQVNHVGDTAVRWLRSVWRRKRREEEEKKRKPLVSWQNQASAVTAEKGKEAPADCGVRELE